MYYIMGIHYILVRLLACIAGFCIAFLIVGIGSEAIMRTAGLGLIKGIIDLSEYSLFLIAILSAPWLVNIHGHIRVDILINQLSGRNRQHAERCINLFVLITLLIVLYYSFTVFLDSWRLNEMIYRELTFPDWWVQWQIPLAAFLICVELLQRVLMPNWDLKSVAANRTKKMTTEKTLNTNKAKGVN